jgi:hypothetical protein
VYDPNLNSIHLDLSRRDEFRRARQVMLEARGTNTIQIDARVHIRKGQRGETIADPPAKCDSADSPPCGFVLVEGKKVHPLKIGVNTIGRLPDNDVVITDPHASRRHTSILVHSSMRCEVHDLASKNGTYLNGNRLTCATLLRPNDEIRVGDLRLVFTNGNEITNASPDCPHNTSVVPPAAS